MSDLTALIKKNNLSLARTSEEILERIENNDDIFGFATQVLIDYLPWEHSKSFYKDEFVASVENGQNKAPSPPELETKVQAFVDYMKFAWEKATNQRGLSASRSIQKLGAHLWALGRQDLYDILYDERLYAPYGAPALVKVCDEMGIDVPENVRAFSKDMRNCSDMHEPESEPYYAG